MALQSMTALASITLQAASASVSFSGIPQNYRDLILIENPRHESSATGQSTLIQFNGDSGANYTMVYMAGNISNSTGQSGTGGSATSLWTSRFNNNDGNNGIAYIIDYSATNKHKTVISKGHLNLSAGLAVISFANRWANTAAINSMTLFPETGGNYAAGSTFDLYGRIS